MQQYLLIPCSPMMSVNAFATIIMINASIIHTRIIKVSNAIVLLFICLTTSALNVLYNVLCCLFTYTLNGH